MAALVSAWDSVLCLSWRSYTGSASGLLGIFFRATITVDNRYCQTSVLGLGLGVDFTFAWVKNNNNNDNNNNANKNPHLNFLEMNSTRG